MTSSSPSWASSASIPEVRRRRHEQRHLRLICQELGHGTPSVLRVVRARRHAPSSPSGPRSRAVAAGARLRWGDRLLRPDRAGFGSNPGGMLTTARKDGDDYVLNGRKMWITNGTCGGGHRLGKTEDGIRDFIVPTDLEAVCPRAEAQVEPASVHHERLVMEDVRVPASAMLPGRRASAVRSPADPGPLRDRLGPGTARRWPASTRLSTRRASSSTSPWRYFQLAQAKLAEMGTQITMGQMLALRLGRLKDEGTFAPSRSPAAQQRPPRPRDRPHLPRHAGCERHQPRVPDRAACRTQSVITHGAPRHLHAGHRPDRWAPGLRLATSLARKRARLVRRRSRRWLGPQRLLFVRPSFLPKLAQAAVRQVQSASAGSVL